MKVKNSYELKEVIEAIKKENPDLSEKEIERKAIELFREIRKLDEDEARNEKKYWKHVEFSAGYLEDLDRYLIRKGFIDRRIS